MACAVPQQCAPRFRTLLRLYMSVPLILSAVGLVLSLAYLPPAVSLWLGILTALCIAAAVYLPGMYYERRYYTRHTNWLKLESGLFVRSIVLIPRGQVICTRLRRGPLERMLGLYTLVLITPAGQVTLPGLLREDAARLRELMGREESRQCRTQE